MVGLLDYAGFAKIDCNYQQESAPDIDDFAAASLNAYCQRLENKSQQEVFTEQFKEEARDRLDPDNITVNRLYLTAHRAPS